MVTIGCFDQPTGYAVNRPRGADSWLFTWTTGGCGRLVQGAVPVEAAAGNLVVLGPGMPHRYAVGPAARHWAFWWVHCQARASWSTWLRPYARGDRTYAVTPVPGIQGRIDAAFHRMLADARWTGHGAPRPDTGPTTGQVAVAHGTAARELALCSLEEIVLIATATAGARADRRESGIDPRVRQAQELMDADPGAPHTVQSLAAEVALSPSRFAHLFTQHVGQSPMRALQQARLRHAARLLEATELPAERVAALSGFTSPFHFSRAFRQRYGSPPGAYRSGARQRASGERR
ncbi:helix-turn-helix domain-containing protein [Streptomyces himalayensis]|uniref:Helix-turn-helix domain-containing protein n=1 Tax=Streptomyces himalayensis subsp. himalayensis TaxID=2756131 RepID=A0A7W0DJB9_9ACTN|nr:helix-turn-helix domain-containing protein [Streptomyces himalayensis]MBA2946121.1 helix-turn-helix domain-containing protein [Streptomyces himalayensis subsp. himalayensis]